MGDLKWRRFYFLYEPASHHSLVGAVAHPAQEIVFCGKMETSCGVGAVIAASLSVFVMLDLAEISRGEVSRIRAYVGPCPLTGRIRRRLRWDCTGWIQARLKRDAGAGATWSIPLLPS